MRNTLIEVAIFSGSFLHTKLLAWLVINGLEAGTLPYAA